MIDQIEATETEEEKFGMSDWELAYFCAVSDRETELASARTIVFNTWLRERPDDHALLRNAGIDGETVHVDGFWAGPRDYQLVIQTGVDPIHPAAELAEDYARAVADCVGEEIVRGKIDD